MRLAVSLHSEQILNSLLEIAGPSLYADRYELFDLGVSSILAVAGRLADHEQASILGI
jgi:hypothetical protein